MTIRNGQKMYRVRDPAGFWAKKGPNRSIEWIDDEHKATFWRKLSHLRASLSDGIFVTLEATGLPLAALSVVEYGTTIVRTGRKQRLTELSRFYTEDLQDGAEKKVQRVVAGTDGAGAETLPDRVG